MRGANRRDDPDTSKEAARLEVSKLEGMVFDLLRFKPLTTEELAFSLNKPLQSITPRMAPLRRKGMVFDSGLRKTGSSGCGRIVWAAATEIVPEPVKSKRLQENEILEIARRHTKYMNGKTAWAMDVVALVRELEARWNIK